MRICILDGNRIKDREMLHDTLADSLGFPDWYGRNLDALYDCLTDLREETQICVQNENQLGVHLGGYAAALQRVLAVSAQENEKLMYITENQQGTV